MDERRNEPATAEDRNGSPGDHAFEDDLTEEREVTPQVKDDVAHDLAMDP